MEFWEVVVWANVQAENEECFGFSLQLGGGNLCGNSSPLGTGQQAEGICFARAEN